MLKKRTTKKSEDGVEKSSDAPIKIVYMKDVTKEQYEVTDSSRSARDGAIPVSPSNYKAGAINHKITIEDIEKYPALKGFALPGDIVDKNELEDLAE